MNTIDLTLFDESDGFEIKLTEKTYVIKEVSAINELKIMQNQEDISNKISKWKSLAQQDLVRWKEFIKSLIKEQNSMDLDESEMNSDINKLKPIQVVAIMYGLLDYLKKRTNLVFNALSEETRAEAKKLEKEVKKKMIQEQA